MKNFGFPTTASKLQADLQSRFSGVDGILVEAFGVGNLPADVKLFLEVARNMSIWPLVVTECQEGDVLSEGRLHKAYASTIGKEAFTMGDITTPAAYTKMVVFLSRQKWKKSSPPSPNSKTAVANLTSNHRGE
jgi:L-asparaginase/Glu-tRNA(Gln) amidotransferase subunit D